MNRVNHILVMVIAITLLSCNKKITPIINNTPEMTVEKGIKAPSPRMEPKEMTMHGDVRIDNYYWMRLSDEQKNAENPDVHTQEVLDYLNAENNYRETKMAHTDTFQEMLFDEIVGRIKQTDLSVPYKKMDITTLRDMKKERSIPYLLEKKNP